MVNQNIQFTRIPVGESRQLWDIFQFSFFLGK